MPMGAELAAQAVPDLGAFLARLVRMDPIGLVRLRPGRPGLVELWARLPFEVMVTRVIRSELAEDVTVRAAELLAGLERGEVGLPTRHDLAWRAPLPPGPGEVVETVPAREFRRIAQAAAQTLRAATGRGVGERRLRDELLSHTALVVTQGTTRHEVPLRLVQGAVRMGFLGPEDDSDDATVRIRHARGWLGADARFGCAWYRAAATLGLQPASAGRPVFTA